MRLSTSSKVRWKAHEKGSPCPGSGKLGALGPPSWLPGPRDVPGSLKISLKILNGNPSKPTHCRNSGKQVNEVEAFSDLSAHGYSHDRPGTKPPDHDSVCFIHRNMYFTNILLCTVHDLQPLVWWLCWNAGLLVVSCTSLAGPYHVRIDTQLLGTFGWFPC